MSINILDDEVLKRNQQLISSIKDNKTLIEAEEENKKTQFAVLYDGSPRKAVEDARRSVEIDINSANNRTPTQNVQNDPRTDEINFQPFEKGAEKWNKISSSNPGVTKSNIGIDLENRDGLDSKKDIPSNPESEVEFKKFEKDAAGKWQKLDEPVSKTIEEASFRIRDELDSKKAIPSRPTSEVEFQKFVKTNAGKWQDIFETKKIEDEDGEETDEEELISAIKRKPITKEETLRIREELGSKKQISSNSELVNGILNEEENRIRVSKLINEEGKLIDPEDAKEDEEFPIGRISRRDFKEIEEQTPEVEFSKSENEINYLSANNEVKYNKIYQNDFWKNDLLGEGRAIAQGKLNIKTVDASKLEIRNVGKDIPIVDLTGDFFGNSVPISFSINETRLRELAIFAFMLFPYFGTDLFKQARNTIQQPDVVGLALSSKNFVNAASNLKYFTILELGAYLLHNFYTLNWRKRHTIKQINEGRFFRNIRARQWNGLPDKELIKGRDEEGAFKRGDSFYSSIGYILVAPVAPAGEFAFDRFTIPIQFNPNISESDRQAEYESTKILSRLGEIFSYSGTSSLTVTLDAEYIATAHDEINDVGTDGNNWMSFYTLEKIQAIEKAYRSLVLPHYPEVNNVEGYSYVRPPLLRVIIGGANASPQESGPYANILTYGTLDFTNNASDSLFGSPRAKVKNFIATGVKIEKDIHGTMRLDRFGRILDTMGFKVSLNLTEVTASYSESLPTFGQHGEQYLKDYLTRKREQEELQRQGEESARLRRQFERESSLATEATNQRIQGIMDSI